MTSLALIATTVAADGVRTLARSDCAAVHLARRAIDSATVVCPAGDEVAIEYALAAGIRNVVPLQAPPFADFRVAYVGTGCAELVGDVFLARWVEMKQAALMFDVIRCAEQSDAVHEVECDAGRGARHLVTARGRLILILSNHAARPAYVSRYRRHSARQAAVVHASAQGQPDHQARKPDWGPVRPRVRAPRGQNQLPSADDRMNDAFSIRGDKPTDSTNVIVADPETCARHILRYLAHHSLVSRATADGRLEAEPVHQVAAEPRTVDRAPERVDTVSLGGFMGRRPRQADDSLARSARQPRPFESAQRASSQRESHV